MQARGALLGIRKSRAEPSIHRGLWHSAGLLGGLSLRLGGFSGRISEARWPHEGFLRSQAISGLTAKGGLPAVAGSLAGTRFLRV
jgi:hypothetical protein